MDAGQQHEHAPRPPGEVSKENACSGRRVTRTWGDAFLLAMSKCKLAWLTISLCLVAACGPPPVPGSALETKQLADNGPRIHDQSIFVADDVDTLRALVDASSSATIEQLGGAERSYQCRPPYALGQDFCWPGQRSQAGRAYIALVTQGGFCINASSPQVYLSAHHLVVQVRFSKAFNCHATGTLPMATASLISFATSGLKPGLYSVSFQFVSEDEIYNSGSTYLSLPGPPRGDQARMENEATAALNSVTGIRRVGLFSLTRVEGSQLQSLCGQTVSGPAYLAILDPDLSAARRQMTVVLAGPTPKTCITTPI